MKFFPAAGESAPKGKRVGCYIFAVKKGKRLMPGTLESLPTASRRRRVDRQRRPPIGTGVSPLRAKARLTSYGRPAAGKDCAQFF